MTVNELNDLIARGAGQPGVREVEELMRLGQDLARQARELVELYGDVSTSTVAASTGVAGLTEPTTAKHAHLG